MLHLAFLHNGQRHAGCGTVGKHLFAFEEVLELLLCEERAETGRFAFVREVRAEHGLAVGIEGHVAPKSAPQTAARNGHNVFHLIAHLAHIEGQAFGIDVLGFHAEAGHILVGTSVERVALGIDNHVGIDHFVVFLLHSLRAGKVADVEGCEYLLFLVEFHVLILRRLERRRNERKKERHDHYHNRSVGNGISVTVRIHCSFVFYVNGIRVLYLSRRVD